MTFTTLHELGHVRGHTDFDFQGALAQAERASQRDVEEDACEAFAAELLLPAAVVDPVVDQWNVTARAVAELVRSSRASREASAVAIAHRMVAPGYVAIVSDTDHLQFAARSGDVLPLGRGSDQRQSVVRELHAGRERFRGRGRLLFRSGSATDEMFVDALAEGPVVYIVATTDHASWLTVSIAPTSPGPTEAWCENCSIAFHAGRICPTCGEPIHAECGGCGCAVQVRTPTQMCKECWLERPVTMFVGSSTVCTECTE